MIIHGSIAGFEVDKKKGHTLLMDAIMLYHTHSSSNKGPERHKRNPSLIGNQLPHSPESKHRRRGLRAVVPVLRKGPPAAVHEPDPFSGNLLEARNIILVAFCRATGFDPVDFGAPRPGEGKEKAGLGIVVVVGGEGVAFGNVGHAKVGVWRMKEN